MKKVLIFLLLSAMIVTFSSCERTMRGNDIQNNGITNEGITNEPDNNEEPKIEEDNEKDLVLDIPEEVVIQGERLTMDQYVAGVVAAELQNWFNEETFIAFAIAARTNTVKRLAQGKELINSTAFQCYYSVNDIKQIYGDNWEKYYNKFYKAACDTHNQIIVDSDNLPIDAMYHAISSGKTEDSKYVTGYSISYLKSVESPWDKNVSCYEHIRFISYDELLEYGFNKPNFKILSYTSTDRPYIYEVCGENYTATELMYKLQLRSAVFEVQYDKQGITFTTYGFGHNLGMSAYGAEGMAKEGYTHDQIINHFYSSVNIKTY